MSKTEELQAHLNENAESVLPYFKNLIDRKLGVDDTTVESPLQVLDAFTDEGGDTAAIVYVRAQRRDSSGQPMNLRVIHQFGSVNGANFEKTEVVYQSRMPEVEVSNAEGQ